MVRPFRLARRPARFAVGLVLAGAVLAGLLAVAFTPDAALAQVPSPVFTGVIDRLRNVVVGLLAAAATLFLTVGGARYLFAGGDPGQIEKAKHTLQAAAWGYGIAALAVPLFTVLKYIVGA